MSETNPSKTIDEEAKRRPHETRQRTLALKAFWNEADEEWDVYNVVQILDDGDNPTSDQIDQRRVEITGTDRATIIAIAKK